MCLKCCHVTHTISQQMDTTEFYLDKMAVYTRAGKHFSSFKRSSCKCRFVCWGFFVSCFNYCFHSLIIFLLLIFFSFPLSSFESTARNLESCVLFVYFILSAKFNFYSIISGNPLYLFISRTLMFSLYLIPANLRT